MSSTPFIIPVFIPQAGCPHQCVFCNQETITGSTRQTNWILAQEQARQTVHKYLSFKRNKSLKTELALFGGNSQYFQVFRYPLKSSVHRMNKHFSHHLHHHTPSKPAHFDK